MVRRPAVSGRGGEGELQQLHLSDIRLEAGLYGGQLLLLPLPDRPQPAGPALLQSSPPLEPDQLLSVLGQNSTGRTQGQTGGSVAEITGQLGVVSSSE